MNIKDQIFFVILAGMLLVFLLRFASCAETVEIERNRYWDKTMHNKVLKTHQKEPSHE